jgi:acetyl esterase/lipase
VMYLHGGALIMGDRSWISQVQVGRYLQAGFAVVSIDYRLAPETKLENLLEDVKAAHQWIREKGPELFKIDPNQLVVAGSSAGGYLTLMCGVMLQPKPKALVAFYGYGDIVGPWYSEPDPFYLQEPRVSRADAFPALKITTSAGTPDWNARGRFYLYCRQNGVWPNEVSGHDPKTEPGYFKQFCPIRNVSKTYPPTMLLHGNKDTDVPYQQSVDMAAELERAGVEHQFLTVDGGGHSFDMRMQDPTVAAYFDRAVAFLLAHSK